MTATAGKTPTMMGAIAVTTTNLLPPTFLSMSTRIVTFRCPTELLRLIDNTADHFKRSRNTVLLTAVRLFSRQLREQGGALVPPMSADMLTRETMFPHPENRGGRPRKKHK